MLNSKEQSDGISPGFEAILIPLGARTVRPDWPAILSSRVKSWSYVAAQYPSREKIRLPERGSFHTSFLVFLTVSCLQKLQTVLPLETNYN